MSYWGYHLILDCARGDVNKVSDGEHITSFAKTLVDRIGMEAFGEPQVVSFGEGHLKGYTLVQLIHTSNICAHFCDCNGDFYLDVFSCREYDKEVVKQTVQEFFNPETVREIYLTRQA